MAEGLLRQLGGSAFDLARSAAHVQQPPYKLARLSCLSQLNFERPEPPIRSHPSQGTVFPVCYDPVVFRKASAR